MAISLKEIDQLFKRVYMNYLQDPERDNLLHGIWDDGITTADTVPYMGISRIDPDLLMDEGL